MSSERPAAESPPDERMRQAARDFTATLSAKAKLITYGVGFGVGLGVPSTLGLAFAIAFGTPAPLILPLVFAVLLLLAWLHRTIGYRVGSDALVLLRPIRPRAIAMSEIAEARFPASWPPGNVFGLWRVEGFFGAQGTYWNKAWGRFRVFVTNDENTVELRLESGERVLVSPDDPESFVSAIRTALPQ
jgi:hypothetical protein